MNCQDALAHDGSAMFIRSSLGGLSVLSVLVVDQTFHTEN